MTQLPLTRIRPASHRADPVSSRIAEEQITLSGQRETNAGKVSAALRACPGAVASELVEPTGLDVVEVRRRLDDLHKLGLAYQGDVTRRVGRAQVTWYAVAS